MSWRNSLTTGKMTSHKNLRLCPLEAQLNKVAVSHCVLV
uniref:Uncharacterized protein n=1 Tax=Setaria italica TaxID=4555 RepID=K4APE1_SETIT